MRYGLATGAMAAIMAFAVPASAEMPAVSGLNFKAEGFGGILDEDYDAYGIAGSVAFPIVEQIGVQIDVLGGAVEEELTYGVGGHIFWRSPSVGMIGIAASYMDVEDLFDVQRYQFEGEYYFDSVTLGGVAGWQDADIVGDAFVVGLEAKFYATDDFMISTGVTALGFDADEDFQFALGAEVGLGSMVSLFADAKIGTESDIGVLGGIKVSFGNRGQSVKMRHRLDDPDNLLLDGLRATDMAVGHAIDAAAAQMGGGGGGSPLDPILEPVLGALGQ